MKDKNQVSTVIPRNLHTRVKLAAVKREITVRDATSEALENWLKSPPPKQQPKSKSISEQ